MEHIGKEHARFFSRSQRDREIVEVIRNVAPSNQPLALNATIEAAER